MTYAARPNVIQESLHREYPTRSVYRDPFWRTERIPDPDPVSWSVTVRHPDGVEWQVELWSDTDPTEVARIAAAMCDREERDRIERQMTDRYLT